MFLMVIKWYLHLSIEDSFEFGVMPDVKGGLPSLRVYYTAKRITLSILIM
jgi:hypothetical protein